MPAIQQNNEYIAFISYRHKPLDSSVAKKIQRSIESFTVPAEYRDQVGGKRLGKVFRDEDELPASANLSESIRDALDHARFLIVICTPDLPQSHWCEEEIRYFLKTHDRDQLLAVLAEGEPQDSFSPYMLHTFDEEGNITGNVEPLAANLKQPYKKEFIRLCAAMLGCSFDALWQRDRRKRANRRMGAFAGAALLLAAFTMVVLMKNHQINEQKSLSEKRLSEALVSTGQNKLASFDRKGALEDALQATQIEDPQNIDPQVDALLADALGAYEIGTVTSEIFYTQSTDITELKVTDDEACLLVTDMYGKISCIDQATGTIQWEYISKDPWITIYTEHQGDRVLCKGNERVFSLSIATGQELWSYEYNCPIAFQALSHDGTLFAIMDRFTDDPNVYKSVAPLHLLILNTEDGTELGRVLLSDEAFPDDLTNYETAAELGGAFSEQDKLLLVSLYAEGSTEDSEEKEKIHRFFAIDVQTLEKTYIGRSTYPQEFFYGMDIADDASEIYIVFHSIAYGGIISIHGQKNGDNYEYDVQEIDHDINTQESGTAYNFYGQYPRFHFLPGQELNVISSDNRLFLIRRRDNVVIKTYGLAEGTVRSMCWTDVSARILNVSTSNGYLLDLTFKDPDDDGMVMPRYTSFETDVQDICLDVHTGPSLLEAGSTGQYYSVSETTPGQIIRSRYHSDPHIQKLYQDTDIMTYLSNPTFSLDGTLLTFSGPDQKHLLFDTQSGAANVFELDTVSGTGCLPIDEDHVLYGNQLYQIETGASEEFATPITEGYPNPQTPSAHIYLQDGRILSWCTGYNFTMDADAPFINQTLFWIDRTPVDASINMNDYPVKDCVISSSGWAVYYGKELINTTEGLQWETAASFQCLYVPSGTKHLIREDLPADDTCTMVIGHQTGILAALYSDSSIHFFDMEKETSTYVLDTYKNEGILAMDYSEDDRFLMIVTSSGRLDIYDTATMHLLFSKDVDSIQETIRYSYQLGRYTETLDTVRGVIKDDMLEVFFGRNGDLSSGGLLIDLQNWVVQAKLSDVKCYDPDSGKIYFWEFNSKMLYSLPLYNRADLKAWAEEELNE